MCGDRRRIADLIGNRRNRGGEFFRRSRDLARFLPRAVGAGADAGGGFPRRKLCLIQCGKRFAAGFRFLRKAVQARRNFSCQHPAGFST